MKRIILFMCGVFLYVGSAMSEESERKLLFLTHAALYKHASLADAERAVAELGEQGGFSVTTLEGYKQEAEKIDLSMIDAEYLSQFDGLMMMTNGNLPLRDDQKQAITEFIAQGNGFVGVHCASLTLYDYPEFGEMLGGYFRKPVQQRKLFVLKVEDTEHPATRMLGASWPLVDEFYFFGTGAWSAERPKENIDTLFGNRIPVGLSRDRVRVLLSIDTEQSDIDGVDDMKRGGDYPQAWCREYGEGRSFYTALGHRPDTWSNDPVFRLHILGGIRWALGLEAGDATPLGSK